MKKMFLSLLVLVGLAGCNLPPTATPSPYPTATPLPPTITPLPPTFTPLPPPNTPASPTQPGPSPEKDLFLIVQSNTFLLGGVQDGAWFSPQQASLGATSATYQFYDLQTLQASAQGKAPLQRESPPCMGAYDVELDTRFDVFHWIGTDAPWEVAPRPAEAIDPLTIQQIALLDGLLAQNGAARLDYQQVSAFRADLEGDGIEEIILTATALQEESLHMVSAGEYSLAAVLRADSATLLLGDFYTAEEMAFPSAYAISAILDLNGDGRMEVVVHDRHWEGNLLLVYEISADGARRVLDTCCAEEAMYDERCLNGNP